MPPSKDLKIRLQRIDNTLCNSLKNKPIRKRNCKEMIAMIAVTMMKIQVTTMKNNKREKRRTLMQTH